MTSTITNMGKASNLGNYTSVSTEEYTAPCDGIFFVGAGSGTRDVAYGYINGIILIQIINYGGYGYPSQCIAVRKGTKLKAGGTGSFDARFYPYT